LEFGVREAMMAGFIATIDRETNRDPENAVSRGRTGVLSYCFIV